MRILRKGKGLLETFKCKLGYHEWVAVHWSEFKQRPRRAIFSKKGGRRKAHNGWQTTCINDLDLEDLKKLRRVIRKAIREYENN